MRGSSRAVSPLKGFGDHGEACRPRGARGSYGPITQRSRAGRICLTDAGIEFVTGTQCFPVSVRTVSPLPRHSRILRFTRGLRPGLTSSRRSAARLVHSDGFCHTENFAFDRPHEFFRPGLIALSDAREIDRTGTSRRDFRQPDGMKRRLAHTHPTCCTVVTKHAAPSSNASDGW